MFIRNISVSAIPVFTEINYEFWSIRTRTYFLSQDLWDVVESGISVPENTVTLSAQQQKELKEGQKKDASALFIIQQAVEDTIFQWIMGVTSAKVAWDTLKEKFQDNKKIIESSPAIVGCEPTWEPKHRVVHLDKEFEIDCPVASSPDNGYMTDGAISNSDEYRVVEPQNLIDQQLYKDAKVGPDRNFKPVLENKAREKGLALSEILEGVSPSKNTLLHVAANFGKNRIARSIARCSASLLRKKNLKGDTALHLAARAGHFNTAKELLDLKCDQIESSSFSANENTVQKEDVNKELPKLVNDERNTALHEALIHGHVELAKALIKADPEVSFYLNKERKSPLYLAAEAGHKECIAQMLEQRTDTNADLALQGKPSIHAAVINAAKERKTDILDVLLVEPRFICLTDKEGRTALHLAASTGYLQGVFYFLEKHEFLAFQRDKNGLFPIHVASIEGHLKIIKALMRHFPDPGEMLTTSCQNILHLAAKSGSLNVVSYVLKTPELESFINQRDKDGNTPLHLVSMNWHPKIVSVLTRDKRVKLQLVNKKGFTALDAAEHKMGRMPTFRQLLTWATLKAVGTARASFLDRLNSIKAPTTLDRSSPDRLNPIEEVATFEGSSPSRLSSIKAPTTSDGSSGESRHSIHMEPRDIDSSKERVNTLLLVSTLIATITFAAGFTAPGGFNDSDPEKGMAIFLKHKEFCLFILCDMIAMYSSIIVAITLIWAQLGDQHLVLAALKFALPLLGVALVMMSLAFMAGIYLVVSKLKWLGYVVLATGSLFLVVLSLLFFPLSVSHSSTSRILRFMFYYSFEVLVFLTDNHTKGRGSR